MTYRPELPEDMKAELVTLCTNFALTHDIPISALLRFVEAIAAIAVKADKKVN